MHNVEISRSVESKSAWELRTSIWLPRSPDEAFAFFGDAGNLEELTPPWLKFRIVTPRPIDMHAGTLIDYRLKISGIPVGWRTEITEWDPPRRFVDTQVRGPYRLWVHEHVLTPENGGTRVDDCVTFRVPGGWLMYAIYIRRALRKIFTYRQEKLEELLGERACAAG